jgi:hypothetical protein
MAFIAYNPEDADRFKDNYVAQNFDASNLTFPAIETGVPTGVSPGYVNPEPSTPKLDLNDPNSILPYLGEDGIRANLGSIFATSMERQNRDEARRYDNERMRSHEAWMNNLMAKDNENKRQAAIAMMPQRRFEALTAAFGKIASAPANLMVTPIPSISYPVSIGRLSPATYGKA